MTRDTSTSDTPASDTPRTRPRFSIVTAVHDVEPYLSDFIGSIERQRVANADLEIVAVDDGSTDGSLDVLRAWAASSRFRVKVLTQPNAGQGSARNLGLRHATGEWVTFTDPDDMLDRNVLRSIDEFALRHPGVELLASKPVLLLESQGRLADTHPRRRQYEPRNRVVDMDQEPNAFPGSSAVSYYRRERLEAAALEFDERVRPNFEDGHFTVRYLLALPRPVVGLVRDAIYVYRKRAAGTSALQQSLRDPGRYTTVLELGYLDVIERARARHGRVPEWLQHVLVYELSWYLSEEEKITSAAYVPPEIAPRFHELLARVLRELDPDVVARHTVRRLKPVWVAIFGHAGRGADWHSPYAVRTRLDRRMRLRRIAYRYTGERPAEVVRIDGHPSSPAFAKSMAHRYYGSDLLYERILWLPAAADTELELAGEPVPILQRWPRIRRPRRGGRWRRRVWAYRRQPARRFGDIVRRRLRRAAGRAVGATLRALADLPPWRRTYRDAWLLMDRIHDADDNGERLFEHLRESRPDVNAWFVIEKGTPDWDRLRARGERRLLAHGSFAWKMAMLNCTWLLSSHVDLAIYRPPQLAATGPATWRVGFLQHGVIKDDLSRWLNHRELELFVVSTEPERASIAGDRTTYHFTDKETRNTGLPRFDRLLAKAAAVPEAGRDLVLVAPTWRSWLTLPLAKGSQRRQLDQAFWESDYIVSWTALLRSEAVRAALSERGWRLGFMPHPNLQSLLDRLDLPPHVQRLAFAGTDVQDLYARCGLLVTDYSSVAFNTAYIDRPVVYFQFDREAMFGGAHVGRGGYFDYGRDGFGPVVEDVAAAEQAIVDAISRGPRPTPEYQARIDATFPVRDGGACARVVEAIEERSRPHERAAVRATPPAQSTLVRADP